MAVIAQGGNSLIWFRSVHVTINLPGLILFVVLLILVSTAFCYMLRERLRRWCRFSLRTLFIATAVAAVAASGLAYFVHRFVATTHFSWNWEF